MGNPFLRAVIANPDDDLTRLVYADWLDEHGQPERAEFVRVQVALAAGVSDDARRRRLEDRQRELLVAHDQEWVAELAEVLECPPGRWGGWVFRRGFVEYFHLPAGVVADHGAEVAELTPVRELYLNPTERGEVERLCDQPWFARVRDLYLVGPRDGLDRSDVWALVDSPHTTGLAKMELGLGDAVWNDAELLTLFETKFRRAWKRPARRLTREELDAQLMAELLRGARS
jgi:uncharacterized protein (TIGR02996 family)